MGHRTSWICGLSLLFVALAPCPMSAAADVAGAGRVVDGDTLDVAGFRIDLWGIDAPERDQRCWYNKGGEWACGAAASRALADLMAVGRVNCVEKARRPSGRILGVCTVEGTETELQRGDGAAGPRDLRSAGHAELCRCRRLRERRAPRYVEWPIRAAGTLAAHVPVSDVMGQGC